MPRKNKKLPRHLLVIRTSAMGDVAMLPHALRALKEAYPEVKVTVATKSLFHPFFEGVDVDFLDIETRRTHRGIRGKGGVSLGSHGATSFRLHLL